MNNTAQAVTNSQGYTISRGSAFDNLKSIDVTSKRIEADVKSVKYYECVAHDLLAESKYSILMQYVFKSGVMPHHKVKRGRVGARVFVKVGEVGKSTVWHTAGTRIFTVKGV